jgi:hypothetical protein
VEERDWVQVVAALPSRKDLWYPLNKFMDIASKLARV